MPFSEEFSLPTSTATRVRRLAARCVPDSRHARLLAAAGLLAATVVMVAGGRVGLATASTPFTRWLGLLARNPVRPRQTPWPGLVLAAGVCALVVVWLLVLRAGSDRRQDRLPDRQLWTIAGWWALPFLIGPPLLSSDVFSYAAQGMLVAHGHDPYTSGPSALGWGPTLAAVDPSWRSEPSPYGPLATLVEHLSVVLGGGTALGAVIVLRLFAAISVVAIGILAGVLAGPDRRSSALCLTVLNPLVLIYVVGGVHFEGVMCALLLAAIYAANRGQVYLALMLGCAAGAIKAPALVAVLAIVFMTFTAARTGRRRPDLGRLLVRSVGVIGACWLVFTLLVPNGWGWLRSLGTPALTSTPAAISTMLGSLVSVIIPAPSQADAAYAGRVTALVAAILIAGYLLVTSHHRPLIKTTGLALVAISLLSPVFYPWYALWGLVCLAPVVSGWARYWLVALSALAVTVNLPGLTTPRAAIVDIAVGLAVAVPLLGLTQADLLGTRGRVGGLMRRPSRAAPQPSPSTVSAMPATVGATPVASGSSRPTQRKDDWIANTPTPVAKIMNSMTESKTTTS
jgi:hypothetical protein